MLNHKLGLGLVIVGMGALAPERAVQAQVPVDDDSSISVPAVPSKPTKDKVISGLPGSAKKSLHNRPQKVEDGDVWKKHPPVWSLHDPSPHQHPYATNVYVAPGIGAYPGGPNGQFGSPYYYTNNTQFGNTQFGGATGLLPVNPVVGGSYSSMLNTPVVSPAITTPSIAAPVMGPLPGGAPIGGPTGFSGYDYGATGFAGPGSYALGYPANGYTGPGYPGTADYGYGSYGMGGYGVGGMVGYGALGPGGPQMAALPGMLPGNPYLYHFGPGFYRYQEAGHYRFPYYSYRRPWYFPGHPSYNRDTNIPW